MKYAALTVLLLANSAFANGLDDLKAALVPLQGQGALRGTYEAREQKSDAEKPGAKPELAQLSAQVEDDAGGLQLRWERALLKRAADEAKGGKRNAVLERAISANSGMRVAESVNYAPKLLRMLANSQLTLERADTWQGKPARLLELKITPPVEADEKTKVKENTVLAQVWLGADGVPLGATLSQKLKISMMAFLSIERASKDEFSFAVHANRLVLLRREEQGSDKNIGGEVVFRNLYTFMPKG